MGADDETVRAEDSAQLQAKLFARQHVNVEVEGVVEVRDDDENVIPGHGGHQQLLGGGQVEELVGDDHDDGQRAAGQQRQHVHEADGQQHARGLGATRGSVSQARGRGVFILAERAFHLKFLKKKNEVDPIIRKNVALVY